MSEMEREISGSLFGGYNKKSADTYIEELQAIIENLQKDLESAQELSKKRAEKLAEVKGYYKTLWERSIDQEEILEQQENEIKTNKNVINAQKETIRSRGEIIRNHEDALWKEKQTVLCLQGDVRNLTEELDRQNARVSELEAKLGRENDRVDELKTQLEQKEQAIRENQDLIAQLEDKIEKQQWLYEEFFKNKGRVSISKLEQYIHESMRKRVKRKH